MNMFTWLKNLFIKPKKEIIMIAAIQNDHGIGFKGNLIHGIKNDMKHFVSQTTGHTIIMGRKNWESIPEKYRPFKDRENIVITRDKNYHAKGAIVVTSLEEAIKKSTRNTIYIIGGGQIYTLGMKYADVLDLTQIHAHEPADVFFPEFKKDFMLSEGSGNIYDEKTGLNYEFQIWIRK